ncbi:hypothetical protein WA026_003145, partial [Henosepilachna vigintioctopunctata]
MSSSKKGRKVSIRPEHIRIDKGISFKNFSPFRRKMLSSFKFCKLRGLAAIKFCQCEACNHLTNEKCLCLECDLEEVITFYFYYKIMRTLLKYYQVQVKDDDSDVGRRRWTKVDEMDDELDKVVKFAKKSSSQATETTSAQLKRNITTASAKRRSATRHVKRTRSLNNEMAVKEIAPRRTQSSQDYSGPSKHIKNE